MTVIAFHGLIRKSNYARDEIMHMRHLTHLPTHDLGLPPVLNYTSICITFLSIVLEYYVYS